MCQACVSVAEASQAPMLYAAGFAAVGTAGLGWVRRRFGAGDAPPDDDGDGSEDPAPGTGCDEVDADEATPAGSAPPVDVEHVPATTSV